MGASYDGRRLLRPRERRGDGGAVPPVLTGVTVARGETETVTRTRIEAMMKVMGNSLCNHNYVSVSLKAVLR